MNNADRKALARAFSAAKDHLSPTCEDSRSKSEFICLALRNAMSVAKITESEFRMARAIIESRLKGRDTFTDWLICDSGVPRVHVTYDRNENDGRQAQITRAAWLDSLIAEFSSPA